MFDYIEVADGRIWLLPEGTRYFCGDLSEEEQKLVWATAMAPAADVFARPFRAQPGKPAVLVRRCIRGPSVNPELERFVAKRMNAKTTEIVSSHVPMLSHPDVVVDVIREAAASY